MLAVQSAVNVSGLFYTLYNGQYLDMIAHFRKPGLSSRVSPDPEAVR